MPLTGWLPSLSVAATPKNTIKRGAIGVAGKGSNFRGIFARSFNYRGNFLISAVATNRRAERRSSLRCWPFQGEISTA